MADHDRTVGKSLFQGAIAGDVVAVAVRDENRGGPQVVIVEVSQDFLGLEPRIDDQTVVAPLKMGNICVFVKGRRDHRSHTNWG